MLDPSVSLKHKIREIFTEYVSGRSKKEKAQGDKTIKASKHQQAIAALVEASKSQLITATEKMVEVEETITDDGTFKATCSMFRTVYMEAQLHIPLYQHNEIVPFLKSQGLSLGTYHYERTSAMRMLHLISETFLRKLVISLVKNDFPISLILDATTDGRGKYYAIVYLRSIEQDKNPDGNVIQERPVMYFYKLIKLGVSETADAYMDALRQSFNEDIEKEAKLYTNLQSRLVGLGSDDASVMNWLPGWPNR